MKSLASIALLVFLFCFASAKCMAVDPPGDTGFVKPYVVVYLFCKREQPTVSWRSFNQHGENCTDRRETSLVAKKAGIRETGKQRDEHGVR